MNDVIRAVILGVVEGLTEFLPISSTGHMILVMPWIGISGEAEPFWNGVFNFFIQIGAILAVVIYFWRRLWRLTFHPADKAWHEHFLFKLLIAMVPAGVLGVMFDHFMKRHLMKPPVVAVALVLGGLAILVIERAVRHPRFADAGAISLRVAFLIGLIQCLAMVPGVSRSGATIMGALVLGLTPVAAAEFSFFLAIPTLVGAGMLSLVKGLDQIQPGQRIPLALGFLVAFVVAWGVVAAFMNYIRTHQFTWFALYRIVLGGIVLAWMLHQGRV